MKLNAWQAAFWTISSVRWFGAAATEDHRWRWALAGAWLLTGLVWTREAMRERQKAAARWSGRENPAESAG